MYNGLKHFLWNILVFYIQRKSHRSNNQNASRLVEKYNNLAREASSAGDKILSESYYQFSDHYIRVLNERERNQNTSNNLKEKSFNGSSDEIKDAKAEDKPATS